MDFQHLLNHWGYPVIFVVVILGNLGVPVPEETILILAGYLVWDGELRLGPVLFVGIFSAVAGDNLGYWAAREYGRPVLDRYGHRILITPARLEHAVRLVARYGALAVFIARFAPGFRFLAGPVAGATGVPPLVFVLANVCGAALYVPAAVGVGYAAGYGFGDQIAAVERAVGRIEHWVLVMAAALALGFLARRAWRSARKPDPEER